ncbi:SAM-dependent methyltransferase [Streptomyces sp. NPDC006785]|uniref:SAM-dependent methyltransferase n=1 Tax=Streptomyces sp. NPDC006785 TaxID=3155461 RepID=UPI0033F21F34
MGVGCSLGTGRRRGYVGDCAMGLGQRPLARTVDVTVASVARMYDFLLRGKDSYPADRAACERLAEAVPDLVSLVESQRAFSLAAVHRLATRHGVRQFLDFGCGLPSWVNTHQVAQQVDRASRVVYIDRDPMVVAHGRAMLEEQGRTAVVQGDLLDGGLFSNPRVSELIDFTRPVAVMMTSVLHCLVDDDRPVEAVRNLLDRLAGGSFLVLSQWVSEDAHLRDRVARIMYRSTAGAWGKVRTPAEVDRFFHGLVLEEPGLGDVSAVALTRRADTEASGLLEYGGVGRLQL